MGSTIIDKHEIPTQILIDLRLEFNKNKFKELAKKCGYRLKFSSPWHYETKGPIDRANQALFKFLKNNRI